MDGLHQQGLHQQGDPCLIHQGRKWNHVAVDKNEGFIEKVKDFFWQGPEDRSYEDAGGDDRVPEDERTNDPKADANKYARDHGEEIPYPDHANPTDVATGIEDGPEA